MSHSMDSHKPCACGTVAHLPSVFHAACAPCPAAQDTGCVPIVCPVSEERMSHSREQDLSADDESAQQRAQHTRATLDLLRCTAHPNECDMCVEVLCAIAGNVGVWIAAAAIMWGEA